MRQGEIYWVADCPPLHGKVAAPHAVIILNPPQQLKDVGEPVYGMVISSSIPSPGTEHISMPNAQTHDPCNTGLTKPCWAVVPWVLRITDRAKLGKRAGYLSGKTLEKVIVAYVQAVADGALPIEHPTAQKGGKAE